jgi:hypothetical protein
MNTYIVSQDFPIPTACVEMVVDDDSDGEPIFYAQNSHHEAMMYISTALGDGSALEIDTMLGGRWTTFAQQDVAGLIVAPVTKYASPHDGASWTRAAPYDALHLAGRSLRAAQHSVNSPSVEPQMTYSQTVEADLAQCMEVDSRSHDCVETTTGQRGLTIPCNSGSHCVLGGLECLEGLGGRGDAHIQGQHHSRHIIINRLPVQTGFSRFCIQEHAAKQAAKQAAAHAMEVAELAYRTAISA